MSIAVEGFLSGLVSLSAMAGGSGLNTVVIGNQASANSCALANYYCERRQVPPENQLRVLWTGSNISWTADEFQTVLLRPLLTMLAERGLTNQVDYVVLSMDFPFQTTYGGSMNSTTAALFYGLKPNGGSDWKSVTNSYAGSERVFSQSRPLTATGYSFLATMLTGGSLEDAMRLVDQGVDGDGTFPSRPVLLEKTSDPLRNLRQSAFDNAIFNARLRNYAMLRVSGDSVSGTNLLGCETGLGYFDLPARTFVPGAIADTLTSYGGVIFGPNDQTTLLAFIKAGAAGSYGTVTEPSPDPQKFPDAQTYFYQARGFSLAECYYQGVVAPYEGLMVAEPLSAPFARPGQGRWTAPASNAILSGTALVNVRFIAPGPANPVQRVDLFVDGKYSRTLTNLCCLENAVLTARLNGFPIRYPGLAGASLDELAGGLASAINSTATNNSIPVSAANRGDRIELHWLSTNTVSPFYYPAPDSAVAYYRAVSLPELSEPVLSQPRRSQAGAFQFRLEAPAGAVSILQASTNLVDWVTVSTDIGGGALQLEDPDALYFPQRFYRVLSELPQRQPRLSLLRNPGAVWVRAESQGNAPYLLESSTDLRNWEPFATNASGGSTEVIAPELSAPAGFFRARLVSGVLPNPTLTPWAGDSASRLLRVDGVQGPWAMEVSSDLVHWQRVFSNNSPQAVQLSVENPVSTASAFLLGSSGTFLDSQAFGRRTFSINGAPQNGTWLQLALVRTNGHVNVLSTTNETSNGSILDLARQMVDVVNATAALQGPDGVVAEDLCTGVADAAVFTLRARSPGLQAAGIRVRLAGSPRLWWSPKLSALLDANLSDLQPRNHLYVGMGAPGVSIAFPLDTTTFSDGFHELTAVAYEGSNVRVQTRATVPVRFHNRTFSATLASDDLPEVGPVDRIYHLTVAASGPAKAIRLYSSGGLLDSVSRVSTAAFKVNGSGLGSGLHPFYAIAETEDGHAYRTPVRWVRLVR